MNIPTIFDILDRLAFLRGAPAVVVILALAAVAVVAWDLRLTGLAMLGQYLFGGLLLVDVLDPRLAVVGVIGGVVVALMLLVTGRQVAWGRRPAGLSAEEAAQLGLPRARQIGRFTVSDRTLLAVALSAVVLLVALWLGRSPGVALPFLPAERAYLEPAIAGLVGLGLVGLAVAAEPLPSAVGLLLFLSGFALYYGLLDPSITAVVALVGLQIVVALVAAYLAQAHHLPVAPTE